MCSARYHYVSYQGANGLEATGISGDPLIWAMKNDVAIAWTAPVPPYRRKALFDFQLRSLGIPRTLEEFKEWRTLSCGADDWLKTATVRLVRVAGMFSDHKMRSLEDLQAAHWWPRIPASLQAALPELALFSFAVVDLFCDQAVYIPSDQHCDAPSFRTYETGLADLVPEWVDIVCEEGTHVFCCFDEAGMLVGKDGEQVFFPGLGLVRNGAHLMIQTINDMTEKFQERENDGQQVQDQLAAR